MKQGLLHARFFVLFVIIALRCSVGLFFPVASLAAVRSSDGSVREIVAP